MRFETLPDKPNRIICHTKYDEVLTVLDVLKESCAKLVESGRKPIEIHEKIINRFELLDEGIEEHKLFTSVGSVKLFIKPLEDYIDATPEALSSLGNEYRFEVIDDDKFSDQLIDRVDITIKARRLLAEINRETSIIDFVEDLDDLLNNS